LAGTSFLNKKLLVRLGISPSILIYSSTYKQQFVNSLQVYNDTSNDDFSSTLFSGMLHVTYLIYGRVGLDAIYQRAFTDIYKADYQYAGKAKHNLLSLGMSYNFFNKLN
jgi:hypothetical protein